MSKAVLLAALIAAPSLSGCKDACLSLAEEICACQPDPNSQQVCRSEAKAQEQTFNVGKADQAFCQRKLDDNQCNCDLSSTSQKQQCCNRLNTAEGRAACGLVYPSP